MDCRLFLICLSVLTLSGSYAYSYGRYDHGHRDNHRMVYSGHYGEPYGYGYGYYPRRGAYIHGAIFDHEDDRNHDDHHEDDDDDDDTHDDHDNDKNDPHERIWRFQVGDDYGAYEYLDSNGFLKGFVVDLMKAVCEKAEKKCFFLVDTNSHCWDTDGERELPGIGLLDHYYDGCLGLWQSKNRLNSFNFTLPFTPNVRAALFHKAGEKIESPKTVTGSKIGFVQGWAASKKCFEQQHEFDGNSPGKYTPILFETQHAMIDALAKGEIDGLVSESTINHDKKLPIESTDPLFECTVAGASVMTHYGSEVLDWWNTAFLQMKEDGSFRQLCETAATTHGTHGEVHCEY